ncbi:snoRNA-binding rRNA-processing protein [Exophiala xenobiotica]|nr:snoRNA-binding rRNA-processing protein [Exophiala xenobiotica]KAK5415037.1 snoRNA-binding rRNA-processing protein [Exophiala xenobiotica]KAK5471225.1 snoRNA-binding rRNA-processing protein [Exophiala xenobiotica]KAK5489188.1 snoRNA-binding rRNA-processing protein [Exophiala xenobiotica]KAK5502721.1 snoRNA-binding rRNA-processing protein [Exophiala xenobiotica]
MSKTAMARRHNPLEDDISTAGGRLRTKSITGKRKSRSDENAQGDGYIDAQSSRKILAIAQDLADEDAADRKLAATKPGSQSNAAFGFDSRFATDEDADDQDSGVAARYDDEEEWIPEEDEVVAEEEMDPEDMAVYKKFLQDGEELADFAPSIAHLTTEDRRPKGTSVEGDDDEEEGETTNLTDLILQRIAEKEALEAARNAGSQQRQTFLGSGPPDEAVEIPVKVVETFTKVGQLLSRYKSGPLPKPFKVLPTLPQWPELLSISRPENWSPHAVYRATKIFISAPASTGRYFCETVLLDRVREDIQETKKLNVHLYNALKAAFYRPSAFFKGFLFTLVQSSCTLREAHIISSVLAKIKIPVLHSAAALLRLCELSAEQTSNVNSEAAGAANIFIRVLLAKKYALPYKVVDALVFHFLRFRASKDPSNLEEQAGLASKEAKLPVLWHQSLLIFAQTYRNEITEDQREALLDLLLLRGHKDIGPEVRRELLAGRNRAAEGERDTAMVVDHEARDDGDDTMDVTVTVEMMH